MRNQDFCKGNGGLAQKLCCRTQRCFFDEVDAAISKPTYPTGSPTERRRRCRLVHYDLSVAQIALITTDDAFVIYQTEKANKSHGTSHSVKIWFKANSIKM